MAKTVQKITLSASRDIPFDRLVLSQANVRRVKAGVSIEELAADIARRTLLQSITVRPVLDDKGAETGIFEIPAGGRRYRALELLVRQKRLAKSAPIPCIIRTEGIAEEDSLAENVQRAPLHPLDQYRAYQALREKGQSEEEIAAVFFVAVSVVKQRLRLAAVSPRLLDVYAEDEMTLDQLMAFSVSPDHERQEQVWEAIQRSYNKEPYQIRRMLTEGAVRASDKRAQYAGDEYVTAGGAVMRDLFQQDDGGWLQDAGLLARLVAEKLERDADSIRIEGWKWVETATEFPYGHSYGMRRIASERRALSEEEIARVEALRAEAERIEEEAAEADEVSDEADLRLGEIEAELEAIHQRPAIFDPADIAMAAGFDTDSREALFAHCVSLALNATHDAYNRRPRALAHASSLAETLSLDLVAAGWAPTAENYLGRVTKARILEAVREAKGELAAQRIEPLKKGDMAVEAERLLVGTGWLPEPLRTAGVTAGVTRDDRPEQTVEPKVQAEPVADDVEPGEPAADPAASDGAVLAAE